jgi:hypothetical protein
LNDSPSSQRLVQTQPQLAHVQPARESQAESQAESQVHVGVQEQSDVQVQLLEFALAGFASSIMVFMRHLVFGLPGL